MKRIMEGLTVDEEGEAYSLAWGVVKRAQSRLNWERVDAVDYVGLGEYLDAECFDVLPVKCRDVCLNTDGWIRLAAYGACNQRKCSWGPLRRL